MTGASACAAAKAAVHVVALGGGKAPRLRVAPARPRCKGCATQHADAGLRGAVTLHVGDAASGLSVTFELGDPAHEDAIRQLMAPYALAFTIHQSPTAA